MKEKIYFIVYFSNMIFWTLRVFKNLSRDYEKEKHADVYESHMRMYRRVAILEFTVNALITSNLITELFKFFN